MAPGWPMPSKVCGCTPSDVNAGSGLSDCHVVGNGHENGNQPTFYCPGGGKMPPPTWKCGTPANGKCKAMTDGSGTFSTEARCLADRSCQFTAQALMLVPHTPLASDAAAATASSSSCLVPSGASLVLTTSTGGGCDEAANRQWRFLSPPQTEANVSGSWAAWGPSGTWIKVNSSASPLPTPTAGCDLGYVYLHTDETAREQGFIQQKAAAEVGAGAAAGVGAEAIQLVSTECAGQCLKVEAADGAVAHLAPCASASKFLLV